MRLTMGMVCAFVAALAVALAATAGAARADQACELPMPERVVALGMIGGQVAPMERALRDHGLIDDAGAWSGGQTHLVVLSEIMIHGEEILQCMQKLHALHAQAQAAGGRLHLLMAPSTVMVLRDDLSNVQEANYSHMATPEGAEESAALMERRAAQLLEFNADFEPAVRKTLQDRYKDHFRLMYGPGAWEFTRHFAAGTELGDWMRSSNAVLRLGDVVFSPGGISEEYAGKPLREINDAIRAEASRDYVWVPKMADTMDPMWWRELSTEPERELRERVDEIMTTLGARAMVIGHSPQLGESFLRGRVIHLMSGLTPEINAIIIPASLEIVGDRCVIHQGARRIPARLPAMPAGAAPPQAEN